MVTFWTAFFVTFAANCWPNDLAVANRPTKDVVSHSFFRISRPPSFRPTSKRFWVGGSIGAAQRHPMWEITPLTIVELEAFKIVLPMHLDARLDAVLAEREIAIRHF
jgi:hypothetical protein